MSKVEELLVEIQGDNNSFKRALRGAEGAADGFGGKMGKMFGGVTRVAGAAALAVGAIGTAALGFGVKIASETEGATTAFTTLLGSAEEAEKFIGEMRDFAAKTPFEFAGVRDASQQFLAMGFEATKIVPMLTAVGDAVSAMGGGQEEINGVTRALTQMQAKGKVSAEEMLQLAERGIPAWQMLAEAMGTDIPSAMKEVSSGAVEAGVFMDAFLVGSASRFGGAMVAQSQTLAGLFSTLKDTISVSLGEAAGALIGPLKDALPVVATLLGDVITTALPPLVNGLAALLPAFLALTPAIGSIAVMIGETLGAVAPVLIIISEALAEMFDGMDFSQVAGLKGVFAALGRVVAAILPILAELAGDVFTALLTVLVAMAPALNVVADILNFLAPVLPALIEGLLIMVTAIKIATAAQWLWNIALNANPIGLVVLAVAALIGAIILIVKHWDVIRDATVKTWDAVKGAVMKAVDWMVDAFFKFHPLGIFIKHWAAIKAFFATLPATMLQAGRNIVQGLIDGIKNMGGAFKDAIVGTVKQGWDSAKNFLGISSPSKLFMELGQYSVEGLMQPFDGVGARVVNALEPIGRAVAPSPQAGGARSTHGDTITFQRGAFEGAFAGAQINSQVDLERAVQKVLRAAMRGAA